MVLLNHGLFTFGATSREAYERHLDLLETAERWLNPCRRTHAPSGSSLSSLIRSRFTRQKSIGTPPFFQPSALGRTWQEAAQGLVNGQAGLYFIGTFAGEQATEAQRCRVS